MRMRMCAQALENHTMGGVLTPFYHAFWFIGWYRSQDARWWNINEAAGDEEGRSEFDISGVVGVAEVPAVAKKPVERQKKTAELVLPETVLKVEYTLVCPRRSLSHQPVGLDKCHGSSPSSSSDKSQGGQLSEREKAGQGTEVKGG